MSLISPLHKLRHKSTLENNTPDEKLIHVSTRGEPDQKTNLQKSTDHKILIENSIEISPGLDSHHKNNPKSKPTSRNVSSKSELFNNPPFYLGSLPYKGDKKLLSKLKSMGFKQQPEYQDNISESFQEMLKGEPLKINFASIYQPANEKARPKPKQRMYKKPTTQDTSLENQNRHPDFRIETESGEIEEAVKKTLIITPSNKPINQSVILRIGKNADKNKGNKVSFFPYSHKRNTQIHSDSKESYLYPTNFEPLDAHHHHHVTSDLLTRNTEPDQRHQEYRKGISSNLSVFLNQKFGPLDQIEEIRKKNTSMHIPCVSIAGNGLLNKSSVQPTGTANHSSKHIKPTIFETPSYPSPKAASQMNINQSFRDNNNSSHFSFDSNVKNTLTVLKYTQFHKLQKLLETEIFNDLSGANKISAPPTPLQTASGLNNNNTEDRGYRMISHNEINTSINNVLHNLLNNASNTEPNGVHLINPKPSAPIIKQNNSNMSPKIQFRAGIKRSNSIVTRVKAKPANPENPEMVSTVDDSTNTGTTQSNSVSNLSKSSVIHNKLSAIVNKIDETAAKKKVINNNSNYKYFVGKGNNSALVKRVLKTRIWWEPTQIYDHSYNLRWQQTSRGYKFEKLIANPNNKQLVNHFEYHSEITTKNGLIKSLSRYCEANKLNLHEITPTTFIFNMDDEVNFDSDMQAFAKYFIKYFSNKDHYPKPDPNNKKNSDVWYNFDYRKRGKYQPPSLPTEDNTSPYLKPKMKKTFSIGSNLWVLKPTGLNRGRGIEVFNSLEGLNEMMNQYFSRVPHVAKKKSEADSGTEESEEEEEEKKTRGRIVKSRTFVIQKYIEDLFVVNNRKFDIRVWALVTHDMQLYFFKEGYLRTCSEEYKADDDNVLNKFVHLTNNAIQKHGENYGAHENGNQLSFKDLEKYAEANGLDLKFQENILPTMKELIEVSMESAKKTMNLNDRKYCFEVFGYDFMIDADYKVWLIEINTNPCLDESSPLLKQLIPRMIDDAFKLTVDVLFPKKEKQPVNTTVNKKGKPSDELIKNSSYEEESELSVEDVPKEVPVINSTFKVDGYDDTENMWEHLCSLQYEKQPSKKGKK